MHKKLIPILCLLAATVALVVCMPDSLPESDMPTVYSSPHFEEVSRNTVELKNEIITARLAVRNGKLTPDRAKYFEPAIKAVLLDVEEVITPAGLYDTDELVIVYIDGITDAKVQVFAQCFPYNNYRFEDGNKEEFSLSVRKALRNYFYKTTKQAPLFVVNVLEV